MNKLVRDGHVAVLYSPGFGAGWSTWCHDHAMVDEMLFDAQIADIVDRGGDDWQDQAEAIAKVKYPDSYLGGLEDLRVAWLPQGTVFRIHEYDGSETVELRDKLNWWSA